MTVSPSSLSMLQLDRQQSQQQNYMEELRSGILAEEELIASRSRFGLFSQAPPIALGDDSSYAPIKINKGEDGKPVTKPRQLLAGSNRTGVLKKSFITPASSIHQNDPFKQKFQIELKYQNDMHRRAPMHEYEFKPTACSRQPVKATFEHKEERQNKQKKVNRDETGKVRTQPSNIVTNPTSKIQGKILNPPKYQLDPFERPEQIQRQEKELWKSKIVQDVMFKSMSHGGTHFTKSKTQYGIDDKSKTLMAQKKTLAYANPKRAHHDEKFRPAIRGHGDPISRYPEFVGPDERTKRSRTLVSQKVKTEPVESCENDWKYTYNQKSRPSPSISLMAANCRRYL